MTMNFRDLPDMSDAYAEIQEKAKKKLDAVGKEDGDVDNDGDKDKSDSYLLNRRKVISKAIKKESVEVEEGSSYGITKGSGTPSGPMAGFAKAPRKQKGAMAYDGPNKAASEAKDRILAKTKAKREKMKMEHHQKDANGNTIPHEDELNEADKKGKGSGTKDACYKKVKASAKVWPSAYASGRLVQCRKKGAANYGNKSEEVIWDEIFGLLEQLGYEGEIDMILSEQDEDLETMEFQEVSCWKTHKKVGMKMKGGKLVNDCRPKNEEVQVTEGSEKSYYLDKEAEKRAQQKARFKAQNKEAAKERAAAKRRKERNDLRRQGKYGAVGGYYVTKHMEREAVEYEVMTKKKYADTHKDFKGGTKKEPRVSVYDPKKKATVSRLVKFSEMACGGKPTPPNPKAKKQRVANVGLTSEEQSYIKNNNENIYGSQKEVSNQSNQSSKNETSILSEKDTALDIVKKNIIAKYGKGAIMRKGSNQSKKVKGAKSTVGTNKYKNMADKKKETAADAKKRGFSSVQNYVDTMARYGGKKNYDSGRGLGT